MLGIRISTKKLLKKIIFLSIIIFFSVSLFADPQFPEISRTKVKVGFYEMQGAQEIDKDGNLSGFYYDYLQATMQYNSWDLEFVTNCDWDSCLEMLKNGQIDILCGVQKNPEREKVYDFSEASSKVFYSSIFVGKNNIEIPYEDFQSLDGLTVGLIENSARTPNFFKFCKEHNISMKPIYFLTETELFESLKNGTIDTAMSTSNSNTNDFRIVCNFDPEPQYIAVKKGNTNLLDELNQALIKLKAENPSFDEKLYKLHYTSQTGTSVTFTRTELDFINNNKVFKVYYDPKWAPLESTDPDTKKAVGAVIDILNIVSQKSGIEFDYVTTDSYATNIEKVKQKNGYILSAVAFDYKWANKYNIHLTKPFIDVTLAYVFKDDIKLNKIALPESFFTVQFIKEKNPQSQIITYKNIKECLDAVNSGIADVTILNAYELNYFFSIPKYHKLNFSNIPNFTESFSIGISKDAHPLLYSIINKTLNSISEEEITTVIKNNTHRTPKNSFLDLAYTNPLDFFLILTSIFLLFVIVVILSLFTILTKKKNIEIAESFKVKFDFLSRMSHDLRTPLNAITGYLSLAKDNISNTKMLNEYLDKMNSSSSFLLGLVNDCLDVGKNFSDKLVLHPEPYTYPEFEKTVLAMIEPLCKKKNIKFVYPSDYYKVSILVDKIRFEQIFFNLLTNAIKFTPEGGTVEFLFKNRSIFNNVFSCDYYIKDTGIGISPEFQKKLFTPFEQENNGTDIMSQGSGLGLAIVKSIVELMDGTISVQSEKGKGTTFIVHLDLPIIEIENQEETKNKFEKETETNILDSTEILEGKKVLLIEDHPMNIEIAKELLEKKGMSVVCASNGKEGLETFENSKENEIDLIITDIRMPIMSGQEMTEKIRQLNRNDVKTIPIIAITANILDDDIKIYHKSGINDFVEKPIKPEVLYNVLRKWL